VAESAKNPVFFEKVRLIAGWPAGTMQTVLTIAGFDPSSGAGVTADLMVFAAHGLFGTSCITALTVQSTMGVATTHPVSADLLRDTLQTLDADLPPAGIKVGMVSTADNCFTISRYCENYKDKDSIIPIVLDPVLRSSSGRELITTEAIDAMRKHLLPVIGWVTPNLQELMLLSGQSVEHRRGISKAARILQQMVAETRGKSQLGIVVTGGHYDPPDDFMLTQDGEEFWFPGTRIDTTSTHGTGCAFSSAFLSRLVLGDTPHDACLAAKSYVAGAIANAPRLGRGTGPLNHLWAITQVKDQ
jgi:hydroxymethylpyrimidine/phosphomethylpyrimidine kinase